MNEQFQADPQQAIQAAISMSLSNFNGIFALAATLARHGLIDRHGVQFMHDNMLAPLNNDGALPEMMALQTKRLDELCSGLARVLDERERE